MVLLWLECNSTTTQQTRKSRKPGGCEATKLWLERCYNKRTTNEANDETKKSVEFSEQRIFTKTRSKTVLKGLFEWGATTCVRGIGAGLRVRSKTSGLPIVGDSKTVHVNKSRPFWNKCLFIGMVWRAPTYSNDDISSTHINQLPTAPPSLLL